MLTKNLIYIFNLYYSFTFCVCSPLLSIIIMGVISDYNREDTPWSMLFADYLVLCNESSDNIEERLEDQLKSQQVYNYLPPKEISDDIKLKEYNSSEHATLPQIVTFKYLATAITLQVYICKAWNI